MPEIPHIERVLKLLLLLSNGLRYPADEIMDRLGMSRRTFFRDRQTLLNAGFAIEQHHGRYWINKSKSSFRKLFQLPYFTEEEAWIVRQAIHSIDENNQLKSNLVEKLYSLYNYGRVAEIIVRREQSDNISRLVKAIREKKQVVLHDYHSAHGNSISDRVVEPFNFTANFISVWAFDVESRSNKTFKTARIKKVTETGKEQLYENLHQSLPVDVFRISSADQTPVKLILNMRAYNLIREEYPLAEKYLTHIGENTWQFQAPVSGFEGVGRFIMGLPGDVEIISPQDLKTYVLTKIDNLKKNNIVP